MKFAYNGFDKAGHAVADSIEASSALDARDQLSRKGLYITQLTELADGSVAAAADATGKFGKKRKLHNLVMFTRQLYVLVSSGTQIASALAALERHAKDPKFRAVV